jgi:hypothetical protein
VPLLSGMSIVNCEAHSKFNIPHSRYRQSPNIFFMKVLSNEQGAFMICRVDSRFGRHIMNMQRRPPGHLHDMDSVRDVGGFATICNCNGICNCQPIGNKESGNLLTGVKDKKIG